jgi:hypothetical protein
MKVSSSIKPSHLNVSRTTTSHVGSAEPSESFSWSSGQTSTLARAGTLVLKAGGAGALAFYAATQVDKGAMIAGLVTGLVAGGTVLGGLGQVTDWSGGFYRRDERIGVGAAVGGALGAGGGLLMGGLATSPALGVGVGVLSVLSVLALSSPTGQKVLADF